MPAPCWVGGAGSGLLGPVCVPFDDVQLPIIKLATGKKKSAPV